MTRDCCWKHLSSCMAVNYVGVRMHRSMKKTQPNAQVCNLSSLLPLPLLGLVPNSTGAEELKRKADAESEQE